jgi:hypothetical protein
MYMYLKCYKYRSLHDVDLCKFTFLINRILTMDHTQSLWHLQALLKVPHAYNDFLCTPVCVGRDELKLAALSSIPGEKDHTGGMVFSGFGRSTWLLLNRALADG